MSGTILNDLATEKDIDIAQSVAGQWIQAMIKAYYEEDLFSKPACLLSDKVR
jgi:hypothetical protein